MVVAASKSVDPMRGGRISCVRCEGCDEASPGSRRPAYGDRRQEIVIIGVGMDRQSLSAHLDAWLLTDAEMSSGPDGWRCLEDPFPAWPAPRPF